MLTTRIGTARYRKPRAAALQDVAGYSLKFEQDANGHSISRLCADSVPRRISVLRLNILVAGIANTSGEKHLDLTYQL